eukprot:TRINITY_DN14011_c0_g1_i1.p1 TRINITY_DN14011_c0_g1~~TRINITY_DN14011_c0_g1_i1.p1  ORF type:complete len:386 (-),score=77.54 TRINITY_DN14011_c0_g1_i1:67-1224(-)
MSRVVLLLFVACCIVAVALAHRADRRPFTGEHHAGHRHDQRMGGALAQGTFLREAVQYGAMCLDGTPGLYYHAPGVGDGVNKWYIHHEGGGWCESDAECYGRSQGQLGSTSKDPANMTLDGGYFSNEQSVNPMMWNWNKVFIRYCDGGSFSGNNATVQDYQGHKMYYRGKVILDAVAWDLLHTKNLHLSTDVVISGCSAGGLATYLHVDWWHELLRGRKVVGLPDSGFFLDFESAANYHNGMMWVFQAMNSTRGVNDECVIAHSRTHDEWMCIFAEHVSPFIRTPLFAMQSQYDAWQIGNDLDSKDPAAINKYGARLTQLVKTNLLNQPQHGAFLDSCDHHCGDWGNIVIDGDNIAQAFQKFYNGGSQKLWEQAKTYPCDACCKP